METQTTKNLFISLEAPDSLKADLARLQALLPAGKFNLQPAGQIHLTMGYFRDVDPEKEARLRGIIESVCAPLGRPSFRFNGEVAHGSWVRLREDPNYRYEAAQLQRGEQVRLGLELTKELADLYAEIARQAKESDLLPLTAPETFSPHITLAEAKEDMPLRDIPKPELGGEYAAEEITLQREIDSLHFEILETYRLVAAENQEGRLSGSAKH